MTISSIKLKNFKAFQDYSVSLGSMNILVGPNNCGKSTILSAFRVLEQGLKTGRTRRASRVNSHKGHRSFGHILSESTMPIPLENVHFNYDDSDSQIKVRYSNGNQLFFFFPSYGGITMYWETKGKTVDTPSAFRKAFPDEVQVIPVLGPVEENEVFVTEETVRRAAGTPRASRHFRNYWRQNHEGFRDFQQLIENTWPGMSIGKPEVASVMEQRLAMYVSENRMDRELYWAGLGFQIWCQLLTHISRCGGSDILVVDEPEVYLHPEVQRQLLGILRYVNPNVLFATHSVEIITEADPSEIMLVDKSRRSARRLRDVEGVQQAINNIGSIQNITLTELARNKRLLFVEGQSDYRIVKKFAKLLGYSELATGSGLTALDSGGFESWTKVKALAWGFRKTLGSEIKIATVYDRDYRCEDEIDHLTTELEHEVALVHFHQRKEIENYLLSPETIGRSAKQAIRKRNRLMGKELSVDLDVCALLDAITQEMKTNCSGQYISKYCHYFKASSKDQATLASEALAIFEEKWSELKSRLEIVPGKQVLKKVRENFEMEYGITLTDLSIIQSYKPDEVPNDMVQLVERLEKYRNGNSKAK